MCWFVRCTVSRTASWRAIRTRVFAARRVLEIFLSISSVPLLEEFSGSLLSAATIAQLSDVSRSHLFLLCLFQRHLLARVAHALALVRLRPLVGADLGGDLPHLLPVHALDHDLGLGRRLRL